MLTELFIRNFAIIDDLRIRFSDGLTVLSGETGAGKSIILSAVNLLLGARATAGLIRTGAETAELEALFQIAAGSRAAGLMEEAGHDASEDLLIRRIISRSDRHRIYINGRLATLQTLTPITEHLASISGQHAHQGLLDEDRHLGIIDQFGKLTAPRERVRERYREILPLIERINGLRRKKEQQAERVELLSFQQKEIESAALAPGEDEALEAERTRLRNAEMLNRTVHESIRELYSANGSISERLAEVRKGLEKAAAVDSDLSPHARGVSEAAYQIEDSVETLRGYLKNVRVDERRLEEVEDRLDLLRKLRRKYGGSLEAVMERLEAIAGELRGIENLDADIEEAEKRLSGRHARLAELARELSRKRGETADLLAAKVEKELHSLKMSKT
ncbi:MAG: AAA family ATPase, partial [Desulfobacterales bacterium]|nr:AAA family ATPase [Desulfobacterales bacterium]